MKKINLLIRATFVVAMVFMITGCASTRVTSEWEAPEIKDAPYQQVLVAAITKQDGLRQQLEDAFVVELGPQGVASYPYIETTGKVPRKVVGEAIEQSKADAVLTVSLVKTIEKQNSVQTYSSSSFYDGYYSSWYRAYDPVTVYEYEIVILEVNLYDAKSEKLVWSIQTENIDRGDLNQQVLPYAKTVTDLLRKRGLI